MEPEILVCEVPLDGPAIALARAIAAVQERSPRVNKESFFRQVMAHYDDNFEPENSMSLRTLDSRLAKIPVKWGTAANAYGNPFVIGLLNDVRNVRDGGDAVPGEPKIPDPPKPPAPPGKADSLLEPLMRLAAKWSLIARGSASLLLTAAVGDMRSVLNGEPLSDSPLPSLTHGHPGDYAGKRVSVGEVNVIPGVRVLMAQIVDGGAQDDAS